MKIKQIWIFVFLTLLLLSVSAFAATAPEANATELYYSFDNDDLSGSDPLDLTPNNNDGTNNGATTGVTGIINEAFDFDGADDYVSFPSDGVSFSGWFRSDVNWGTDNFHTISLFTDTNNRYYFLSTPDDVENFIRKSGTTTRSDTSVANAGLVDGQYNHIVIVSGDGKTKIYINGNEVPSLEINEEIASSYTNKHLGKYAGGSSNHFKGEIDEFSVWQESLTQNDVDFLYNSGSPTESQQYPYLTNFTITAKDSADLSSIENFNATVNGTFYDSSNGSIVTDFTLNETDILNITVRAENYDSYNNETYNTSNGDLEALLDPQELIDFDLINPNNSITNQSSFLVNWTEAVSPTNKTVTYNVTTVYTSNSTIVDSIETENLNYTLNLTNFISENYTVRVNATENDTGQTYQHNSTLRVDFSNTLNFFDKRTGNPIENANISLDFPNNAADLKKTTDSNGQIAFDSYQNDNLQTGEYNITFKDLQGFVSPITFTETFNTLPVNESFNLSRANLTVLIKNGDTGELITENVSVAITDIGTFSTTNGNVSIVNQSLLSQEYTVYVSSQNFTFNQKDFIYTNQEELTVEVFVLDKTDANLGTIIVNTYDSFQNALPGVDLRLQELNIDTGSFEEIGQRQTSSGGAATFQVLLEEKTYRILANYQENGETFSAFSIKEGEIFYADNQVVNIYIDTTDPVPSKELDGLRVDVTNTSLQNNISFHTVDFIDSTGVSHEVCLRYSTLDNGQKKELIEICQTGSSGTISQTGGYNLSGNFPVVVDAFVKIGSFERLQYTQTYTSEESFEQVFSPIIRWLIGISLIAALGISLYLQRPDVFLYATIAVSVIWSILAPSWMSLSLNTLNILFALSMMYISKQRSGNNVI